MTNSIRFILSSKIGKEGLHKGKSEIVVKMYLTRTIRLQIKSGVYVNPKNFSDSETGIVVPKLGKLNMRDRKETMEAKQTLDSFVFRLSTLFDVIANENDSLLTRDFFLLALQTINASHLSTDEISFEKITELMQVGTKAEEVVEEAHVETIYEMADAYLHSKDPSENYCKHFYVTLRCMARYEMYCQLVGGVRKHFSWDVRNVKREDIEDFAVYLKNEDSLAEKYPKIYKRILEEVPSKVKGKNKMHTIEGRGSNTVVKIKKQIKQFFNWCNATGRCNNNPFNGVEIGSEHYGVPFYLSIEERNKIADYDLSSDKSLETQRDIFIFQCFVGCRYGDLVKFTKANISNGILEYVPGKTLNESVPVKPRVPLTPKALTLIDKYKNQDPKGRLFPFISNQKYNVAIKKFFTVIGLTRIVQVRNAKTDQIELKPLNEVASSHMARRTFVGAAYKKVKDPNLVGRMSGHVEGSKAFARYREIDDDDLRSVIEQID